MELEQVKKHWEASKKLFGELYEDCQEDWEFLHGINQWSEGDANVRLNSGRPALVLNQLLPYAKQVVNDIKQARMSIRVTPVDEHADIETAEIIQGIIRNIEKQSKSDMCYSTAATCAIGGGVGWLKLTTEYCAEDSFDQEIKIERILDFTKVYPDPNFEMLDGSDMEWCFYRRDYTKERFKEVYPDADPVSFDENTKDDEICLVEFYFKEYEPDTLYRIRLLNGDEKVVNSKQKAKLDENNELADNGEANRVAYELLDERKTEHCVVKKYVLSGSDEPLEEEELATKYIPLIPVVGEEVYINGRREFHSLIRQAKDAQRMYNYHKSAHAEMIALQPRSPWVGAKGSFKSFPKKWANANKDHIAALEYDIVYDEQRQRVEPPRREMPPQGSPIILQEAMGAKEDIMLSIGMTQANMGQRSNEISGIAVRQRQIEGDNATYHFADNLGHSIAQVGRIIVDMLPKVYSTRKIARIIGKEDTEQNVVINQPYVKDGEDYRQPRKGEQPNGIFDLGVGKYDIDIDIGASYSSKRQETADKLLELIGAKPELADITGDLLFEALDLPKAKEIAERLRAQLPPELLSDDPQAARLQKATQAIAQLEEQLKNYDAALQDKAKNAEFEQMTKLKELDLETMKTNSEIQKTAAEIEKMRAETTGFNMDAVSALGGAVQGIANQVKDITDAMEIILQAKEQESLEEELETENKDEESENE